jgi:hypothetical protein
MTETDAPPRAGLWTMIYGWFLILVGWRDIYASTYDRRYREVVVAYAEALRIRIAGTPLPGNVQERLAAEIDAVVAGFTTSKESFSRLLEVELRYFHLADPVSRLAMAQAIRERFQRVATPGALEARAASAPPDLSLDWTPEMTADTVGMLNYIHARYIMNIAREEAVTHQKSVLLLRFRRIAAGFVAVVTLSALVWLVAHYLGKGPQVFLGFKLFIAISVIFTLGYLGAIVSVTQRFQKAVESDVLQADPVFVIGGIAIGQRGIDVAMMLAGVFAVLLYFVFVGGMASTLGLAGGIFPMVENCSKLATTGMMGDLARDLGFCGQSDLMRMFIFAFAAGYAERLVPDVLNRISRADSDAESRSDK